MNGVQRGGRLSERRIDSSTNFTSSDGHGVLRNVKREYEHVADKRRVRGLRQIILMWAGRDCLLRPYSLFAPLVLDT